MLKKIHTNCYINFNKILLKGFLCFLQKAYPSVSTRQGTYAHRLLQKSEPATYRSRGHLLPRYIINGYDL